MVLVANHKLDVRKQNVFALAAEAAPARSSAVDGMWIGNESCFEADKSLAQANPHHTKSTNQRKSKQVVGW